MNRALKILAAVLIAWHTWELARLNRQDSLSPDVIRSS